ncbi:MAG: pobA [Actinomycetia bacterium]|nr:pobA [Actinomycetes bacterium]
MSTIKRSSATARRERQQQQQHSSSLRRHLRVRAGVNQILCDRGRGPRECRRQRACYGVTGTAVHDLTTDHPFVTFTDSDGSDVRLDAGVIAGCDGAFGPSRAAVPASVKTTWERTYPYSWLGILADAAPSTDELIYAWHHNGFAPHSMRSCSPGTPSTGCPWASSAPTCRGRWRSHPERPCAHQRPDGQRRGGRALRRRRRVGHRVALQRTCGQYRGVHRGTAAHDPGPDRPYPFWRRGARSSRTAGVRLGRSTMLKKSP